MSKISLAFNIFVPISVQEMVYSKAIQKNYPMDFSVSGTINQKTYLKNVRGASATLSPPLDPPMHSGRTNNCLSGPEDLFEQIYTAKPLQSSRINQKEKFLHHKELDLGNSVTITNLQIVCDILGLQISDQVHKLVANDCEVSSTKT